MRKLTLLWLLLLIIPIALAVKECGRFTPVKEIPCKIVSTYNNSGNCEVNGSVYNSSGAIVQNLTWQTYTPYCYTFFNQTTRDTYAYDGIEEGYITVEAEDEMVGIGVIIFLILIDLALFIIPFTIKFTNDEVTNMICKRMVLIVALTVLAFVTTIIITLADNQALGITQELFMFQWIFLNGIYISMVLLVFSFFVSVPKLMKQQKIKKRMGEES